MSKRKSNKKVKQMIADGYGNGAMWCNEWEDGRSKLIYFFEHQCCLYPHSYVHHDKPVSIKGRL